MKSATAIIGMENGLVCVLHYTGGHFEVEGLFGGKTIEKELVK